ncbi:MAG: hypothetical protein LAT58_14000, partial [Opitutales bacterium]|nr:hypothetical protein [Opitutales bacterium]
MCLKALLTTAVWIAAPFALLAAEYPEPTDAFKEAWTPPSPVRSLMPDHPRRAEPTQRPDVSLRLSETPSLDEFRRARTLSTPLRPASEKPVSQRQVQETARLLRDLNRERGHANAANRGRIADYLSANPDSPFSVSLLLEKSEIEWKHGYFTDSLDTLRAAWQRGQSLRDVEERRLAEIGLSRLLRRLSQLGQREELRALITEAEERDLGGTAEEALRRARETLWFFENQAEQNVFCGFTAANEICAPLGHRPIFPDVHDEEEEKEFIEFGLSLYELREHSHEAGGNLRLVKRNESPEFPVPSVIHWDFGHYSAITERSGDLYRVVDFHLQVDTWVSVDALNQQASGYFAVEGTTEVPDGYTEVGDEEAKTVFGRHCSHGRIEEGDDCPAGGNEDDCGMVTYSFRMLNPGIELFDTPIAYTPPFGPEVRFRLNYDQRSVVIDDQPDHGNFGPRWTYDFLSYIESDSSPVPDSDDEHWQKVDVVFGNGSFYTYNYNSSAETYSTEYGDRPRLDYIETAEGGPAYQMTYSDGSIRLYEQANSTTATRFYLTQIIDPQGNALTLEYDSTLRLTTLLDSLDQATTITYDDQSADPNLIRSIEDPFGRTATFDYTPEGQLWKITDPEGIVSEMSYDTGDFVEAYTTPYGTWTIEWGTIPSEFSHIDSLFIQVTDPYGDRERVEQFDATIAQYDPGSTEPMPPSSVDVDGTSVSFNPQDDNLNWRNSFYWDKQQMRYHEGDYTKATVYNWLAINNQLTGIPGSVKTPEVGRTWFNYPGQSSKHAPGDFASPSKVVRPVEDEDGDLPWQMTQNEYDPNFGNLVETTDPMGRRMAFEYNPNDTVPGAIPGIDLTAVKVYKNGTWETLVTYSDFTNGLPQTVTDASGLVTTTTYNAEGQPTAITTSKGSDSETTGFIYDDDLVAGPASGASGTPSGRGYLIEVRGTDP